MKRLTRLENAGYKVITDINSGNVFAKKGLRIIKGTSITDIHKKIFGY